MRRRQTGVRPRTREAKRAVLHPPLKKGGRGDSRGEAADRQAVPALLAHSGTDFCTAALVPPRKSDGAAPPLRYDRPMRPMTIDLDRGDARPYFFWDEDLSIAELRERLAGTDSRDRTRLLAKLLREARAEISLVP